MRLPTGRQGMQPPAQAPPHRGFCPGGRALWLGEIAECGVNKKRMSELMGYGVKELLIGF
jgi:hypothetical protein